MLPVLLFSATPNNDTTAAINKAIANIKAKGNNVMPMMVPVLHILIKKFHIDLNIDAQTSQIIKTSSPNEAPFLRFIDDSIKSPEAQVRALTGIDKVTAGALYCDCYGLPENFFSDVNDIAYSRDYGTTHAIFALAIIAQRKCIYDAATYNNLMKTLLPLLPVLIETRQPSADVSIEAVVMLYLSGNAAMVRPEWIQEIIKTQYPDGSWKYKDHTTVLALWALLEAQYAATGK